MKIGNESSSQASDDARCSNILRYLKRIIMLDSSTRDNFDEVLNSAVYPNTMPDEPVSDEESDGDENSTSTEPNVHPLDYFLLAFLCCNTFLRQVLCQKLFTCGLAIPILYPTFTVSPDQLEVMLLPLKSIILEWRDMSHGFEQDAASAFCHIISFCRIGEAEGYGNSKSKIINGILSDVKHDTFFHYDCPHANRSKRISKGVVECSWYIPSGKDSDVFPHPSMLFNLRGNSLKYDSQTSFLSSMSSVVVMIVDTNCLNKSDTIYFLKDFVNKSKATILVIDHNRLPINKKEVKVHLKAFQKNMPEKYDNLYTMHTFIGSTKKKCHRYQERIEGQ